MLAGIPIPMINNAIRDVLLALPQNSSRGPSWSGMEEDALWRELVACILGSRVRYETAYLAIGRLQRQRLFDEGRRTSSFWRYERDVRKALSGNGDPDTSSRYPFYRTRSLQIRQAAERVYGRGDSIRAFLQNATDIREARRQLAAEVPGLGPKQASLFLRNVGYATHVAVLDVHVLTYMNWVGLNHTPLKAVPSVRKYELLEDVFIEHAHSFGYDPDQFDLAVWVVVKVAKEEHGTWR